MTLVPPPRAFTMKRRVLAAAALLWLALNADPAAAQNAVAGKLLFDNTINATGINTLPGACTSCHVSVQNRRTQIGGSPYAEISRTTAVNRLVAAIASQPSMRPFQALSPAQIQDIAAYIADTPETSTDQLNFSASAVNTAAAAQFVDLRHAVATTEALTVVSVAITGANAARFTRTSDTCDQQTLPAGGTCRVTIAYSSPDTAGTMVPLTFTLRQGAATTTFTRTMFLNGAVAVSTPPPGGASVADSGGGALGWPWLAALGAATAALLVLRLRAEWPTLARRRKRKADPDQ
jgi:mono/diheme cytochrome c family protein